MRLLGITIALYGSAGRDGATSSLMSKLGRSRQFADVRVTPVYPPMLRVLRRLHSWPSTSVKKFDHPALGFMIGSRLF